jgi:hypothetical protein
MSEKIVSQNIQNCFVLLCITNTDFLKTASLSIPAEYFGSTISERIVQVCYDFYDKFKQAPQNHFYDEMVEVLANEEPEKKDLFYAYIEQLNGMETPSHTYVLSRMNDFIRAREFKKAALEFVKLAEDGDFDTAREIMTEALKVGARFEDEALHYFDREQPLWASDSDDGQLLITLGIPVLGNQVLLRRKQLVTILGGMKGKKSWWLCWLGREALKRGLKVLFVSHELGAEEIERRFDMMFSGLVSRETYENVRFVGYGADGQEVHSEVRTVGALPDNIDQVMKARRVIKSYGGNLIIKKYPMATCSIGELERLLDHFEAFNNFVPDVLINDYPTIMRLPRSQDELRHQLNQAYMHHKRIADERNLLVITAAQTNKQGLEKAFISRKDIGEDQRILANVDLIVAVSQTDTMEEGNQMRVSIMAARSDKDHLHCMVSNNIAIGQVVVDSWIPEERHEDEDE